MFLHWSIMNKLINMRFDESSLLAPCILSQDPFLMLRNINIPLPKLSF